MGRTGIRTDVSMDKGIRQPGSQNNGNNTEELNRGRWPEMSIIRQTNIDWPNNTEPGNDWNYFLNTLGRMNRGKGRAVSLGSMACSYVTATEFGKMLSKKFPKAYEHRGKTMQLQRRMAENYNDFVRGQERDGLELLYASIENRRVIEDSECIAEKFPIPDYGLDEAADICIEPHRATFIGWGIGTFVVKSLANYSRDELGLDLSVNGQLYSEWQETVDYCRHEGLDTNFIDRNREPHLVVFRSEGPIGAVTLKAQAYPEKITLDPPSALVNNNN